MGEAVLDEAWKGRNPPRFRLKAAAAPPFLRLTDAATRNRLHLPGSSDRAGSTAVGACRSSIFREKGRLIPASIPDTKRNRPCSRTNRCWSEQTPQQPRASPLAGPGVREQWQRPCCVPERLRKRADSLWFQSWRLPTSTGPQRTPALQSRGLGEEGGVRLSSRTSHGNDVRTIVVTPCLGVAIDETTRRRGHFGFHSTQT